MVAAPVGRSERRVLGRSGGGGLPARGGIGLLEKRNY